MISLAEDCRRIQPCCEGFPAVGVQIYGHFVGYRNQYPFCTTWICHDGQYLWGVLGRYNQSLRFSSVLPPTSEQLRELWAFLPVTGCSTLEGEQETLRRLSQVGNMAAKDFYGCAAMTYLGEKPPLGNEGAINTSPRLDDVFRILRDSHLYFARTAQYDQWLCDNSHRLRHGLGWTVTMENSATASVCALSPGFGVIASVATLPEHRGKGYASALVQWCVRRLMESGRQPVLMAGSEQVLPMYRRLGFVHTGAWGILKMESPENTGER